MRYVPGSKKDRNPTDRGKQGVKRSLMTDANGLPLSLVVAGANTHDIKLVEDALDGLQTGRPGQRLRLCLDKGYAAEWLETCQKARRYEPHIQLRKEESEAIKNSDFKTHRWVVERIHSLTNRFRRILRFVRKRSKTTRRCCILHAASLSGIKSYWDRLLVCHYINRIPRRGTCGTPHLNVTLLIQAPHNITTH
ncbi:transposase [Serratia fonticola]|nr:transposase [Serratia fonticola]